MLIQLQGKPVPADDELLKIADQMERLANNLSYKLQHVSEYRTDDYFKYYRHFRILQLEILLVANNALCVKIGGGYPLLGSSDKQDQKGLTCPKYKEITKFKN